MSETAPTYSQSEVVAELTSYYEFLVRMYLPPVALKYPPPEGWPNITSERLAFLGKDDTVVSLLRHIPYIHDQKPPKDQFQIYEKTAAVDYVGAYIQDCASRGDTDPFYLNIVTDIPSHVVVLAQTRGLGRDGFFFFLDTSRGTISICDFQVGGPGPTKLTQEREEGSREEWRDFAAYQVKDFFEMLKAQYKAFEMIPVNDNEVIAARQYEGYSLGDLKDVFHAHGWLSETDDYRKEECMKAIAQKWDEIYT